SRPVLLLIALGLVVGFKLAAGWERPVGASLFAGKKLYKKSNRVAFREGSHIVITIEGDSFKATTTVTGASYQQDPETSTSPATVFNAVVWDVVPGKQRTFVSKDKNKKTKIMVVLVAHRPTVRTFAAAPKASKSQLDDPGIAGTGSLTLTTDDPPTD